ncbi:MAG: amino acid adenylation domain-containing protein [Thiomonas sp.]|nr:amino acid adenylation domain-containing protein [Thiomonas sp.]
MTASLSSPTFERAAPQLKAAPFALSQTQQDILLRQELLGHAIYTIGLTVSIDGALDAPLLQRAMQDVVAAEPMLRAWVADTPGGPQWQIAPALDWALPYTDWFAQTGSPLHAAEHAARDIAARKAKGIAPSGPALWRSSLYRTGPAQYEWLLCFNHLLLDGYGILLVGQRICHRYNALAACDTGTLEPGPSYARFVAHEQNAAHSPRHARDRAFWEGRMADIDTAASVVSTPDLQALPVPVQHRWEVSAARWQRYLQRAAEHGLSPAQGVMFFLASYLAKVLGQTDILIGMPLHNRRDAIDKQTIGLFVNTLPLRLVADANATLPDMMRALADDTRQVLRHQHYPLDRVLTRLPPRQGIAGMHFDLIVSFENFAPHTTLGAARLTFAPFSGHPGFAPVAAYIRQYGETDHLPIDLVLDPRAPAALRHTRFLSARLDQHLSALLDQPQVRLRDLDLLSPAERAALHALQPVPVPRPAPQCLHDLVAEQARHTPAACAVQFGNTRLSYSALDQAADRLAHTLRRLGVGRDVLVPVMMERRLELVVALLGVLKAGGAYVPLDADLPAERLRRILQETRAQVVLTQAALHPAMRAASAPRALHLLDADLLPDTPSAPPLDAPALQTPGAEPDDLGLVIFTSGSTGQPKGVMISHRALCNHALWNLRAVAFGPHDRLLQKSSLSFDASVSEFFVPLLCGAAVRLAPPGLQRDLPALLQTVIQQQITHLTLAPSTAKALVDDPALPHCTSLRCLQFGGEPLEAALAARFQALLPHARLLNFYGPTETTEDSSLYVVEGPITQTRGNLPVGRPIDNTRIDVLDDQLRQIPFDVIGEVCIAGAGVARGYLGQPELSAERFLPDPFAPGERLYKTGDLGYWSEHGQLHITGRNDAQIKIRGFRIELGEIERQLASHPAVAQAAVIPWMARADDPQLAAYLVLREGQEHTPVSALQRALQASLPRYMIPSAWQILPAMPLTASGKIDKRGLPAAQLETTPQTLPRLAPRNPTEQVLWAIWGEVLHTDAFGVRDHFFDLGGHSLTLTQVRSRIHAAFGLELPLADLFTHLSIAELATHLDLQQQGRAIAASIAPVRRDGPLPASLSQRRMWVIQHFHPESVAYNVTAPLRLHGPLDIALFRQALDLLIARHEALRTQFALRDQEPVQIILPHLPAALDIIDLRHLEQADACEAAARQAATAFTARPFDLSAAPLHRVALMQLREDAHVLLWVLHHTIADNWALAVLSRDALQIYAGLLRGQADPADMALPPLQIQYADYAAWQRSAPVAAARETHLAYWMQRLQGLADLPLPTDFPRPAQPSFAGKTLFVPLPQTLQQALRKHGARHGATPFMLLLASFNVLLARITRSADIAVGTPIANRHHAATEQLVGTLVNTLVMRNTVEQHATFDQLLQQVRDTALAAYAHQDAPFDELVERLATQRADHPQGLVRVLFNVLNAPIGKLADVPFTYEVFDFKRVAAQFDLSLHVDTEFSRHIQLEYATELFSDDTAQRLLDSYLFLTEQLLAQPSLPLAAHALLTPPQRALLAQWNATQADHPAQRNLPDFLQLDAADKRGRIALTDAQGHPMRYRELHARALGIAHLLRQQGIGRGDRVGLCLDRQPDMLAALLGVLHAGAAYVPLDPGFPAVRLRYMAGDAQLRCVLTQTALLPLMTGTGVPQYALDSAALARLRSDSALPPEQSARPNDPAYLIYTSGSTGQPKGVQVPHRAVINFLHSMTREPGLQPDDALLAVTTLSFDIAVLELLLPLAVGARAILADHAQARDPYALRDLLQTSGATVLQATPSTWRMLLESGWTGNRQLRAFIGGEALPADLAPRLLSTCAEVWNLYGPTETTVWSTCWRVQPQQPITIGRPIANTQVWVLDPQGQPCPIGTPGEMHIGGDGVALGYFHRPELTAERFIPDPFSAQIGAQLYKTGDLGRWRHDGQLEPLGRLDHQVKVRGFRIELGEIDAALRAQNGVAHCVLTTYAPAADDLRLVAYIVAAPGVPAPDPAALRQALRIRLPDYMVPQHIVQLDALPLLPNGKLDRAALPPPQHSAPASEAPRHAKLPATAEERRIAAIWRDLLGVDRVLLTDNFFDLGGHSLLAMRAVIAIEQQLGWRIAPRRLIFESLGQLARSGIAAPQRELA